jgi:pimeloyl-ACP methyl ester carboxylesterase
MPKVFVHGNPETADLWSVLFEVLRESGVDDLIALSPPGFGASLRTTQSDRESPRSRPYRE